MINRIFILFLFSIIGSVAIAQSVHDHDHDHEHHVHDHAKNEIGIANSPVYFINEKEFAYGLHVHYIRTIGDSKFGLGIGYERIFDEHKHNTIGVVGSYRPISRLVINLAPGVTFEDENQDQNFALHVEATYEYEWHGIHLGPVLEFAYDKEDYHISLGFHVGLGF